VPGLKDSVVPGRTGLLYEYGDLPKLSECLVKILSDGELRERLTQGGLAWAKEFSWDTAAEKTLELMEMAVRTGNRRK
jgi:glycosyltransferase involved in cell wall biosynthesis